MAVNFVLETVHPQDCFGKTVVAPDLSWNADNGVKSDFDCDFCGKGIGLGWKQGVHEGLIALCPHCGLHNKFVKVETSS